MNKRGFGLPQVIAVCILVLVGGIFIIAANLNLGQDAPVAQTAVSDMSDREGHIILMSLLRTPLLQVDALPVIKNPTVADYIVMHESDAHLQTIVGDVLGKIHQLSKHNSFFYDFCVDGDCRGSYINGKCSLIVQKGKPLLHEVSTLLPGPKGNKEVRLKYCWFPEEKQ